MAALWEKIVAFFMSIIAFFTGLFGIGGSKVEHSKSFENLSYGTHERNVLDLYIPEDAKGDLGLVLYIHGGAWIQGDKSANTQAARYAGESLGIAGATINYRYLSGNTKMSDIIDDIDAALRKIKQIGNENGVNINKVILGGHSAGGHLSMLYAYSRQDTAPITPVAVFDQSGPTDMSDEHFFDGSNAMGLEQVQQLVCWATGKSITLDNMNDYLSDIAAVSPVTYIDADTVPTLICHGDHDSIVPYSNAVTLDRMLTEYGIKHEFITYNADHDLNDKTAAKRAEEVMLSYINEYLK